MADRIRLGILGAARITKNSLIQPAKRIPEIEVRAIAARSKERAENQARAFNIRKVHMDYDSLLSDPEIDAVYIPLPNSLHCEWSIRAMQAGKHVLCEKPIASNADEAERMADVSQSKGVLIAEAMHSRYHAFPDRIAEILKSGVLGKITHAEAFACFLIPSGKDIRWQYELGGGALMDLGVYAIAVLRSLVGEEPVEVTSVDMKFAKHNVDRWVDAHFRFPSGATGRVLTSLWGFPLLKGEAFVEGQSGKLRILNPYGPQLFNRLDLDVAGSKKSESVPKRPDTYEGQLRAFASAIQNGTSLRTGPSHFIPNMRAIDSIYRKAGVPLRGLPV